MFSPSVRGQKPEGSFQFGHHLFTQEVEQVVEGAVEVPGGLTILAPKTNQFQESFEESLRVQGIRHDEKQKYRVTDKVQRKKPPWLLRVVKPNYLCFLFFSMFGNRRPSYRWWTVSTGGLLSLTFVVSNLQVHGAASQPLREVLLSC
jgi:hypothetical protein